MMECDYLVLNQPYASPIASGEMVTPASKMASIRIFGCTENGHSILMNVYGFSPYFYASLPSIQATPLEEISLCTKLQHGLELLMRQRVKAQELTNICVLSVDIQKKKSIMLYQEGEDLDFFKITLALPKQVAIARQILQEEGIRFGDPMGPSTILATFESNLPFVLRFLIDTQIQGMSWIQVNASHCRFSVPPTSHCQLELDCHVQDLIAHIPIGKWLKVAAIRIISFDIECCGRDNIFPSPEFDAVIQIANIVTIHGQEGELLRNVFVLGTCTPIVNAQVYCFEREQDLLLAWRDFIIQVDPDLFIGYNITNFDFPYLIQRAHHLNISGFSQLSRIKHAESRIKSGKFSSKAYGLKESKEIIIFGRCCFDLLQIIQRDYKLRSYTLNSVSAEFLNEQKEDVHHSIISKLHRGSADDRRRLAVYCIKDAYLPTRLLQKLASLISYIEMARVTGVPFSYLLQRGQSIRVLSQLYRYAKRDQFLVPFYQKKKNDILSTYEGAIVIEPEKGYYDLPITTLDFASLYPSIMMAYNLCYSTLVAPSQISAMNPNDLYRTPGGSAFVKHYVKKGILPKILEELVQQRSFVKSQISKTTDPCDLDALNARQMALKIAANSVYGFTGASFASLPCIEISSGVTAIGREMIQLTKKMVMDEYRLVNGYPNDAMVIYGDTDSIMVRFGIRDLKQAMLLGEKAAKFVTSKFPPPISLQFEKIYFPYLLISKKRYAGLLWTREDHWDKMDAKGLETVRRDNCLLVKRVVDTCLRFILIDRNIEGAIDYCKQTLQDLLKNRLDISVLVITKALSKSEDEYKGKQAHVELNKKMDKREGNAYHLGDRIPYVIRKGAKGVIASERAEDPIYVLKNNIPIDTQFYVEMLSRPLLRLFSSILENPRASLLQGDHMMDISVPTPKGGGGIIGFTTIRAKCQGCKTALSGEESVLCQYCKPYKPLFYWKQMDLVKQKEREFSRLWTQCQECQGSLHQEVLCTARDCPIFYMRTKIHMDLVDTRNQLELFKHEK